MSTLLPKNHFFLEQSNYIDSILTPLKKFGVNLYTYMANYSDGSQVYLSNNSRWVEDYYNLALYRSSLFEFDPKQYTASHMLWNADMDSEVIKHGKDYFNSNNGITVVRPQDDFCEFHFFSSATNNLKIVNFFINNIDILSTFIAHFKDKAKDILKATERHRILIPGHYTDHQTIISDLNNDLGQVRAEFYHEVKKLDQRLIVPKESPDTSIVDVSLTRREQECLKYLVEGKSAKQTAGLLNLSPRTIEIYIEGLKAKFKCRTKLELIGKFCGG